MQRKHRNGMVGTFSEPDAKGFGVFKAESGAQFTAHVLELLPPTMGGNPRYADAVAARHALWATWPIAPLTISVSEHGAITVRATAAPKPAEEVRQ